MLQVWYLALQAELRARRQEALETLERREGERLKKRQAWCPESTWFWHVLALLGWFRSSLRWFLLDLAVLLP